MERQSIMDDMIFPTFSVPRIASPLVSHFSNGQNFMAFFLRQAITEFSPLAWNSWFVFLHLLSAGIADTCRPPCRAPSSLLCEHSEGKLKRIQMNKDWMRKLSPVLYPEVCGLRQLRKLIAVSRYGPALSYNTSRTFPFCEPVLCIPEMVLKKGAGFWGYERQVVYANAGHFRCWHQLSALQLQVTGVSSVWFSEKVRWFHVQRL